MQSKPRYRDGYSEDITLQVRRLCLYVGTCLGDLISSMRIVGGLVPSLLIPKDDAILADEVHIGTNDLDIGFQVSILVDSVYQEIASRLRSAGFQQDINSAGQPTRQRWIHPRDGSTIDFLIPPTRPGDIGGKIQNLESDFAALITPGLDLAFVDFEVVRISGKTSIDEEASRNVYVCGPAAFVVLKALALRNRGENKDAYDLHFVLKHWPQGLEDIVHRMKLISGGEASVAATAMEYLREDFLELDSIGPKRLDRFIGGEDADDEELRADASALITEFLNNMD